MFRTSSLTYDGAIDAECRLAATSPKNGSNGSTARTWMFRKNFLPWAAERGGAQDLC